MYPFGGIFTHLKMKKIRQNQNFLFIYMHTQLNVRVPKNFKEILLLWYALVDVISEIEMKKEGKNFDLTATWITLILIK